MDTDTYLQFDDEKLKKTINKNKFENGSTGRAIVPIVHIKIP